MSYRVRGAFVGLAVLGAAALMAGPNAPDPADRRGSTDRLAEAAVNYLQKTYPRARRLGERPRYELGTALRRVRLKTLESCLPATRFLATSLKSISEFPEVDVVVAVGRGPGGDWRGLAACLTPVYSNPPRDFLDIFKGLQADSDAGCTDLAADIARIFEAATGGGRLSDMRFDGGEFRHGLYAGKQLWRTVAVSFGADQRITEVRLINPRQPGPPPWPREPEKKA
jgi:hypothetical protein